MFIQQRARKLYITTKFRTSLKRDVGRDESEMDNVSNNFDRIMAGLSRLASSEDAETWAEDVIVDILCHVMCVWREVYEPAEWMVRTEPVGLDELRAGGAQLTHSFAITFKTSNHFNFLHPHGEQWVPWLDWAGFHEKMVCIPNKS